MWLLRNSTPFAAERTWVRDRDGAEVWIVAIKASFAIRPDGRQVLDVEQAPVSRVPKFTAEPGLSSLLHECDLVHTKVATDVLVQGQAYGPGGKPATSVEVRLRVANIDKTLRVCGDRRWLHSGARGLVLTAPEPFTQMPITYERAFGGTDQKATDPKYHGWEARNPVGAGFGTRDEHLIGEPGPNIEDPAKPCKDWRQGQPIGFGPIARHWSPRVRYAGTYDEAWEEKRKPLVPADFDDRFYQCAPEDQQVPGFLKGGETVEVQNMTSDGYLSFRLPRVAIGLTTRFYDGTEATHRTDLHTVMVQPDQRRFQMVWHSKLPCHHKVNKLQGTDVALKTRVKIPEAELESGAWIGA